MSIKGMSASFRAGLCAKLPPLLRRISEEPVMKLFGPRGQRTLAGAVAVLIVGSASACSTSNAAPPATSAPAAAQSATGSTARRATPSTDPAMAAKLEAVAKDAMGKYNLKALIVRVTKDGQEIYTGAL